MKLFVQNTIEGLNPLYDSDFEEKRRLKIGEVYLVDIKKARNIRFHRKYFALINSAWAFMTEKQIDFFHNNVNGFRKTIEIAAGFYEPVYSVSRKEWLEAPKSISFDNMDQIEFNELYERVKDVIFNTVIKSISKDVFIKQLSNF